MKKYLLLPFVVFLCAAIPQKNLEKHPLKKHPDVSKMDFETLHDYMENQNYLCDKKWPNKKSCNHADLALREMFKRGYHWGPDKQPDGSNSAGAEQCWLAPGEKTCF